ncbi:SDR family oxidoreductase [Exiguobacterium artemiae]
MSTPLNKVIFIMGASSGIGEATARLLAKRGATLMLAARRLERLQDIRDAYPQADIRIKQADVTQFDQVEAVIQEANSAFGRIDVLFNNAGIMPTAPLAAGHREDWKQMLDINVMGVLNGIAAALPIMEHQQAGHIIATDSVAGYVVYPESAVYCGTKFAVRAIMEGLRQEQRENQIKSTIISPGAVQTELYTTIKDQAVGESLRQAQQEWGLTSEDVAQAVLYAIDTPDRVSISNLIIRPTQQHV